VCSGGEISPKEEERTEGGGCELSKAARQEVAETAWVEKKRWVPVNHHNQGGKEDI